MGAFENSLRAPRRHTWLCGSVTYLTGDVANFTGEQAVAFSMSEGAGNGLLLGGAFSAACSLTLLNDDGAFTDARTPYGAQVKVFLATEEGSAPLCVFTVCRVIRRENDARLVLSGSDALGTAFNAVFEDDFSYPMTLGALAQGVAAMAGFSLSADFPNAEVTIAARPAWKEITLRQALAHIACAAGCFAAIDRRGALVFQRVWRQGAADMALSAADTLAGEYGDERFGPLRCLTVVPTDAAKDAPPMVFSAEGETPAAQNNMTISGNPLFAAGQPHTAALAQGVLQALTGMRCVRAVVSWRGDPALALGRQLAVTNRLNETVQVLVTRQSLAYRRGFSMQTECAVATEARTAGRLFTPSGALNAARLAREIDGALVADGSLAAKALVAGSVTALQLAAGAVTADKLAAQAVTTDKLGAQAVTANQLAAGAVTAQKIAADVFTALEAHLKTADIDWAQIKTLRAVIAQLADAQIDTAKIDFSQIRDLVAGRAVITSGTAGELYISRLAVTEANMASLTVGEMLVRGQDGAFYALKVDDSGRVYTEKKEIENADIRDHAIHGGDKLIEGSVTAETLNAQAIFADNALIRQLIAANLDVDTLFAREATVRRLNALDIAGNESIRLYVQKQEALNVFLRVTEQGLEIGRAGDGAVFRADNRTMEVTNVKTERVAVAQRMSGDAEWAWVASASGLSLKWVGAAKEMEGE